jgi:hypothetical protein
MRRLIPLLFLLSTACSVTRMLPRGPVISDHERERVFGEDASSGVKYVSEPEDGIPALPLLPFAATYDLDIVLQSDHPKWDMHEYARLQTPDGPIWLAKDSRASDGDQLLVADLNDLEHWMPEIPLARKKAPVTVVDRSQGERLNLDIEYENHDGEEVSVHYEGPPPTSAQSKRNGSTMGHSRDQVLAVLDLPYRDFGESASISIGGEAYGIEKIMGVKPMRMALTQTQAGIAEARFEQRPLADAQTVDCPGAPAFRTVHDKPGDVRVSMNWTVEQRAGEVIARQCSELRTLGYRFLRTDGALELAELYVHAWNDDERAFRMLFSPALPDPRRRFEGVHRSRFVMDVGGQRNHAVGRIVVRHRDGRQRLEVVSEDPWWAAERCVTSTVTTGDTIRTVTDVRPCEER